MRWFVLALFAGCTEYNISAPPPDFGSVNPPELENPVNTDKIVQVTVPSVDVLWVVDNSGSMADEQNRLATNFPLFMDYFLGSGLDYHIGVTSTDLDGQYNGSQGKLVEVGGEIFITPQTDDAAGVFAQMASLGTGGSSAEKGIGATYMALEMEKTDANAGFFRDDATIHTVVVSDEPDITANNEITLDEFKEWYKGLKTEVEDRTFSSIVSELFNTGIRYIRVTEDVGGIQQNIMAQDWTNVLEQLGMQAAGLKQEYFLSKLPVVSTIAVRVELKDGTVLPFERTTDFTYDASRNSITFKEYIPDPLASVYIDYTVLSSMVEVEEEG